MANDSEKNTQTIDNEAEVEQEETPAAEQSSEPSPEPPAPRAHAGGFVAGFAAVVSAGLGLSSITGTSLSDMLRARQEIIGQIEASTGGGGDQVEALYGAPWDVAAVVNGIFALLAVLIGGALLGLLARRSDATSWMKAVALGGTVLGVLGLVIAGGMYLDLFGAQPELPAAPPMPSPGG